MPESMKINFGVDFVLNNANLIENALKDMSDGITVPVEVDENGLNTIIDQLKNIQNYKMDGIQGNLLEGQKKEVEQTAKQITDLLKTLQDRANETHKKLREAQNVGDNNSASVLAKDLQDQLTIIQNFYKEAAQAQSAFVDFKIGDINIVDLKSLTGFTKEFSKEVTSITAEAQKLGKAVDSISSVSKLQAQKTLSKIAKDYNTQFEEINEIITSKGFDFSKLDKEAQNDLENKIKNFAKLRTAASVLFQRAEQDSFTKSKDGFKFSQNQINNNSKTINDALAGTDIANLLSQSLTQVKNDSEEITVIISKALDEVLTGLKETTPKDNKDKNISDSVENTNSNTVKQEKKTLKVSQKEQLEILMTNAASEIEEYSKNTEEHRTKRKIALQPVVEYFNKLSQINFSQAEQSLVEIARDFGLLGESEGLDIFEQDWLSELGLSFDKPSSISSSINKDVNNGTSGVSEEQFNQAISERDTYKAELDKSQQQLKESENKIQKIETENKQTQKDLQQKITKSEKQNKELSDLVSNLNTKIAELEKNLSGVDENTYKNQNDEITKLENKIQGLQKVCDSFKNSEIVSKEDLNRINEANKEIEILKQEIEDLKQYNETLEKINEYQNNIDNRPSNTTGFVIDNSNDGFNMDIYGQINDLADDIDRLPNDTSLESKKVLLEQILQLYNQLPENYEASELDWDKETWENELATINAELEKKIQLQEESAKKASEAVVKETEAYKKIIELQKQYDNIEAEPSKTYNLKQRYDRKQRQKQVLNELESQKKIYNESGMSFTDEMWSDDKIKDLLNGVERSLTGLKDNLQAAEHQSAIFVENANKTFDEFVIKYNNTGKIKDKQKILDEMLNTSNSFNNDITPLNIATAKQLTDGRVAKQKDIDSIVKKFETFVMEKQQEINNELLVRKKSTPKSTESSNTSPTTESVVPKSDYDAMEAAKKAAEAEAKKQRANAVNAKARLRSLAKNNNNNNAKGVSNSVETSSTASPINTTLTINQIQISEEAKTQFNSDLSKIATIYISDVKLSEDASLEQLRNDIENKLGTDPIKVNIVANDAENLQNTTDKSSLKLDITGLNISNPEVITNVKTVIENALSPIFIQSFDGTGADITTIQNRLDEAAKVVTIDRIEINESFSAEQLRNDITNIISSIKIPVLDSSGAATGLRNELENIIAQIKLPNISNSSRSIKSEDKNLTALVNTLENVKKAIEDKTLAFIEESDTVELCAGYEVDSIQKIIDKVNDLKKTIGAIKQIKVVFEQNADDTPKKGKKKKAAVTADSDDIYNPKSDETDKPDESKSSKKNKDDEKREKALNNIYEKRIDLLKEKYELDYQIYALETDISTLNNKKNNPEEKWTKEDQQRLDILTKQKKETEELFNKKQKEIEQTNEEIKQYTELNNIITEKNQKETEYRKELLLNNIKEYIDKAEKEIARIEKSKKKIGSEQAEKAKKGINNSLNELKGLSLSDITDADIENTTKELNKFKYAIDSAIESNNNLISSASNTAGINAINAKYEKLIGKMVKWKEENSKALKDKQALEKYNSIMSRLSDTTNRTAANINGLEKEFVQLDNQIKTVGKDGRSLTGQFNHLFKILGDRAVVGMAIQYIKDGLRQMVSNTKEIDSAMTQLKKVTTETSDTYNKFLTNAGKRAEALGSTMTGLINSTANFAKLGYNVNQAAILAENAIMYSNVGDLDIETATNDIVSATKANVCLKYTEMCI